jgi:imidazolonepropionase-like amidohydrolase
VQRAIEAGVRSIEHGHLLDEETLELMARENVWLSTQVYSAQSIAQTCAIECPTLQFRCVNSAPLGTERKEKSVRKPGKRYGIDIAVTRLAVRGHLQPFMPNDYEGMTTDAQKEKYDRVAAGAAKMFALAKRIGVKVRT